MKHIVLKINDKKETLETFKIVGGERGHGAQGKPLSIAAKANVHYELTDEATAFGPENIATKRVDGDLWIAFEGGDIAQPDLIIEDYFAADGASGYAEGESNLVIGQHENGKYYPYVPESAEQSDAISLLADGAEAGQALGGEEVALFWMFNPLWLLALLPVAAIAASSGGGGGGDKAPALLPPEAATDKGTTEVGKPIVVDVTGNDADKDGTIDPKTVVITKQPANGKVTVEPMTGKVTYTPNPGYHGPDDFEYTVKDNDGKVSNPAKVVIDVLAPPVAADDKGTTDVGKPVEIDVTSNDTDVDGTIDPKTVEITKQPENGTVVVDPITGKVTYTPNAGYDGPDEFEYTVKDNDGKVSNPAKVVIDVLAPPVAADDKGTADFEQPVVIDVVGNDTDKDGTIDPKTVVITKQPANGKVTVEPMTGKVTYTPNPGYHGPDDFEYTVKDNDGKVSNPAKVVIDVLAPPVAADDKGTTDVGKPVEIDVTSNDTDVDGTIDPKTVEITKQPENGKVTVDPITGKVTYTPNAGYDGPDEFEYTVKDNDGKVSNPAKVVIDVLAPPVAADDKGTTDVGKPVEIDVTSNDTDIDGTIDPKTVEITKQPENGTVVVDPITGKVTYTPNPGYDGPDEFEYTVKDNDGKVSNPAKVVIDVLAPPVAADDKGTTDVGKPVEIDVTSNDTDVDGTIDPKTVVITKQPENGTVVVDPITGKVTYTPNPGYDGPDEFEYTVKDNDGKVSNPAKVVIDVLAPPVAADDKGTADFEQPVVIDVVGNDTDKDGTIDPRTVEITKQPANGTVVVDPETGKVTYTPNAGYEGPDEFEYTVKDNDGKVSNPAKVVIDVLAPPVAADDKGTTDFEQPVEIDVVGNDTDKDGTIDPRTVEITKQPANGKVTVDPETGKVTYTPNPGYDGPDEFEYTVKDNDGQVSNPAKVEIDVTPKPLVPPVATDDQGKTDFEQPVVIDITKNDTDVDGTIDPTTVVITKQPANGTVDVDPETGKVTYTPNAGYDGPDEFEYTVKDNDGQVSNPAKVEIDVTPKPLVPPVATDDQGTTDFEQPVVIDITKNDTDVDGTIDPTTVVITKQPANGTVDVDPETGKVTYTPNAGYDGPDEFEYTVKDNDGQVSNPAKVEIDVTPKPLVPPVAIDDQGKTDFEQPVEIDVVGNDTDVDGTIDPKTVEITKQPANGTVVVDPITGKVTYTPNAGYDGPDEFEYTVEDNDGQVSNPAKVEIDVTPKPLVPPTAVDDKGTTDVNESVVIDVTGNDTDVDGTIDPTTVVITKDPANGTVVVDPETGKVTYTPKPGYHGPDEFEYTVKDNDGKVSNPAKVEVDVNATVVNPVEVVVDESALSGSASEGTAVIKGSIVQDNPDGTDAGDLIITPPTTPLTSNGEPITWEQDGNGGLVGKTPAGEPVITVNLGEPTTVDGKTTVSYEVTLNGPVDHAEGDDKLSIDIGISNAVGDVTLGVTVTDDAPAAPAIDVVVGAENTFYANVIVSLDFSSSMGGRDSGISVGNDTQKTRYEVAIDAIETMLDKYQEQLDAVDPGKGDVRVNFSGFADTSIQFYAPNSTDVWMSLSEAKDILASLKGPYPPGSNGIGVNTNYDAALQQVIASYMQTGGKGPVEMPNEQVNNTLFFVSDGIPNKHNSPRDSNLQGNDRGKEGIQETSPSNYTPGHSGTDIGEDKWTEFLKEQNIKSVAIGIGPQMGEGEMHLKPIAYDGTEGKDFDSEDVIVLVDMSSLGDVMAGLVPNAKVIESSIGKQKDGSDLAKIGADGLAEMSVSIDGETYTFDATTKAITSDSSDTAGWKDLGNGVLEVTTNIGSTFTITMFGDKFGDYKYKPAETRPSDTTKEVIDYKLVDKDGDTVSNTLTIDVTAIPDEVTSRGGRSAKMLAADFEDLPVFNQAEDPIAAFAKVPAHEPEVNSGGSSMAQQLDQWVTDQSAIV
ncbi:MAG: tandem-95 repeat protein [Neisseriaceae bacterium]|nr:tandem-95 repeat protein [Neisseriaceae bacterium]